MSVTTTSHKLKQEADIPFLPLRADCSETAQLKRFSSVISKLHQNSSTFRTQNCNNRNTHISVITTSQKPKTLGSGHPSPLSSSSSAATPKSLLNKTTQLRNYIETSHDHQKFLHLLLQSHNLRLKIKMPATKSALPTRRASLAKLTQNSARRYSENPGNLPPAPLPLLLLHNLGISKSCTDAASTCAQVHPHITFSNTVYVSEQFSWCVETRATDLRGVLLNF